MTYEEFKQNYEGRDFRIKPSYSGSRRDHIGVVGKAVRYNKENLYPDDLLHERNIELCIPIPDSIWRSFIQVHPNDIEPIKSGPLPLPG